MLRLKSPQKFEEIQRQVEGYNATMQESTPTRMKADAVEDIEDIENTEQVEYEIRQSQYFQGPTKGSGKSGYGGRASTEKFNNKFKGGGKGKALERGLCCGRAGHRRAACEWKDERCC